MNYLLFTHIASLGSVFHTLINKSLWLIKNHDAPKTRSTDIVQHWRPINKTATTVQAESNMNGTPDWISLFIINSAARLILKPMYFWRLEQSYFYLFFFYSVPLQHHAARVHNDNCACDNDQRLSWRVFGGRGRSSVVVDR